MLASAVGARLLARVGAVDGAIEHASLIEAWS